MTILETIPIMEQAGKYNSIVFFSVLIAVICLFIGACLFKGFYEVPGCIFVIIGCIASIVMIISMILSITEPKIDTGRKQYIIRLDDNININEFYDKYKIVEHTKYTDVYTVEEIND